MTLHNKKNSLITGYQYGDNGAYIGQYRFEKNRDKEQVHCPPCTVLTAPPSDLAKEEQAYFDGKQWQVRRLNLAEKGANNDVENKAKHKGTGDGN